MTASKSQGSEAFVAEKNILNGYYSTRVKHGKKG